MISVGNTSCKHNLFNTDWPQECLHGINHFEVTNAKDIRGKVSEKRRTLYIEPKQTGLRPYETKHSKKV